MGYLGSNASFTGTQNNKRVTVTATQGQTLFTVSGGYAINAIDVYRNGVKLSAQRDFTALDGATVTLVSAANADDNLEFVTFENFQREDVVTGDGDSVIKGNLEVAGDLGITGTLNATVSNTNTAGFSTVAGISSALGVGATAVGLNASGVITATSFSGSGANLTGIAATDDVSTNGLVVLGISTLAGATFSGVSTFAGNVDIDALYIDSVSSSRLNFTDSGSGGFIKRDTGEIIVGANDISLRDGAASEYYLRATQNGSVELRYDNVKKIETDQAGVIITGIATADGFRAGDSEKVELGAAQDLSLYHNGTNSFIDNDTGSLYVRGVGDDLYLRATDDIFIQPQGSEDGIKVIGDGAVELYHDNSKKLETASGGINVGVGITMDGNGIAVSGILTCNGVTVGQNAIGARTVQSGGSPSGGSNGDIYYIY
tara:strand:+ start:537 stop:1826 length:1290 start_codon:yes stop_codon:yes gene_type:complete